MLGAIAGDIIGSVYERPWDNIKTTEFPLFQASSRFTDDTVLTVATADVLLHGGDYAGAYKDYCRQYPDAGYGGMFHVWAELDMDEAYNSFGNGSAMRVSPVGFAFDSIEEVLKEARRSAEVTRKGPAWASTSGKPDMPRASSRNAERPGTPQAPFREGDQTRAFYSRPGAPGELWEHSGGFLMVHIGLTH